ncbi:MAG: DUF222 domain-containing protein [Acidimicrobiia bacterium]
MKDRLVAGEPVELLVEALVRIDFTEEPDGMVHGTVRLEPELGLPFFRALMRAEAELLLQDANALGQAHDEKRTDDQRRADAFVALALRVVDARKN